MIFHQHEISSCLELFLTRSCNIIETDFTRALLVWISEGKPHLFVTCNLLIKFSCLKFGNSEMLVPITTMVISGIPELPADELYCHISLDVGGYVFYSPLHNWKPQQHGHSAMVTQLHWAIWSPTTRSVWSILDVQWGNSYKALVLPVLPSLGHTGVHIDTDRSLCSFCLCQPTHASTRFTCTSWFIECGKQGKQCGKCYSFLVIACYSHLRKLWVGKLYLQAAVLSNIWTWAVNSLVTAVLQNNSQ